MPDESPSILVGSIELFKIIMLTGAIIGVLSVSQIWFGMDFAIIRFDYAGYDFVVKSLSYPESYPGIGYYAYMPLAAFAASAISIVPSVLTFTKHEKKGALIGILLGLVILISVLLYVFYPESKIAVSSPSADMIANIKLMDHLGAGVYSAAVAGMLLITGGTIVLIHRKAVSGTQKDE